MRHRAVAADPRDEGASLPTNELIHVRIIKNDDEEEVYWFRKVRSWHYFMRAILNVYSNEVRHNRSRSRSPDGATQLGLAYKSGGRYYLRVKVIANFLRCEQPLNLCTVIRVDDREGRTLLQNDKLLSGQVEDGDYLAIHSSS